MSGSSVKTPTGMVGVFAFGGSRVWEFEEYGGAYCGILRRESRCCGESWDICEERRDIAAGVGGIS